MAFAARSAQLTQTFFLSLLLIASNTALANNCPAHFELAAELELPANTQATLCWKQNADTTGELRVTVISPAMKKPMTNSFAVEAESQITKIAFDDLALTLKQGQTTLPVIIESRVHESEHDEDITDLWLLQVSDKSISKIFATRTHYASWATQCASDCQDTVRTDVTLSADTSPDTNTATGKTQADGFKTISLQKTETTIRYDQPDTSGSSQTSTEKYRFNGKQYLAN